MCKNSLGTLKKWNLETSRVNKNCIEMSAMSTLWAQELWPMCRLPAVLRWTKYCRIKWEIPGGLCWATLASQNVPPISPSLSTLVLRKQQKHCPSPESLCIASIRTHINSTQHPPSLLHTKCVVRVGMPPAHSSHVVKECSPRTEG